MNQTVRIILAIATLLTTLGCVGLAIWSFIAHTPVLLGITCLMLAFGFGIFVVKDYEYFFGKKS